MRGSHNYVYALSSSFLSQCWVTITYDEPEQAYHYHYQHQFILKQEQYPDTQTHRVSYQATHQIYHNRKAWGIVDLKIIFQLCHLPPFTISNTISIQTRIVCIRPKGRTQCIFPRCQHSCLYIYIYIYIYWIYIKLRLASSRFEHCSNHSRNFFCKFFFLKWPPVAILDVQNHFVSHFLPFQINTTIFILWFFFYKMAAGGHFGCPKFTFEHISGYFISIQLFFIFYKMAAGGHFGCQKITFDRFASHFRTIQNFFLFFFTKWPQAPILDVRNSLSIAFMTISDRYATLIFVDYDHFRSIGHFGCPKFTFDRKSGHFRSIQNCFFRRPFWMSENHFRSHYWPFQIDRPFWMSEIHFWWHF